MTTLDASIRLAFMLTGISGILLFKHWLGFMKTWLTTGTKPGLTRSYAAAFVAFVGFFFLGISLVQHKASVTIARAQAFLAVLPPHHQVLINDQFVVGDSDQVVGALRAISKGTYHHSHPIKDFKIEVWTSSGSLILMLGRDSAIPEEYWVTANGTHIGKTTTHALDSQ